MNPLLALFAAVLLGACSLANTTGGDRTGVLSKGTWGASMSGVIVGDSTVHVHINCTLGDFPLPTTLDAQGRFAVDGQYALRAFPVARETLPAQLSGVVQGKRLTLSIAINDTVAKRPVVLGPVTVTLGQQPVIPPCPICRSPADSAAMRAAGQGVFARMRAALGRWL